MISNNGLAEKLKTAKRGSVRPFRPSIHASLRILIVLLFAGIIVAPVSVISAQATRRILGNRRNDELLKLKKKAEQNQDFPRAARLGPDRETTQILKQALVLAEKKDYESAITLWQRVLDASGNQLVSLDGEAGKTFSNKYRRYETVSRHVERSLILLPRAVLDEYRAVVDGEAGGMLTEALRKRDEKQLAEIVRRYFLSSHGDEATCLLASLRYDQGDYVGAGSLLIRILDDYPDPTVNRQTLLFRLAVINTKQGDWKAARAALAKLTGDPSLAVSPQALLLARNELEKASRGQNKASTASVAWRMELGDPARNRVMPGFPHGTTSEMTELWEDRFHKTLTGFVKGTSSNAVRQQIVVNGRVISTNGKVATTLTPQQMVNSWKKYGWVPGGQIVFEEGRVYYKTENNLICRDLKSGELLWKGRQNRFELDPLTAYRQVITQSTQQKNPQSSSEVQIFGDRVSQEMSISHQTIFNIEGRFQYQKKTIPSNNQGLRRRPTTYAPIRERENWLAAYDAVTGKLKWYRGAKEAGDEADAIDQKKGFLAAPVPFRDSLLVPVSDNGELWLYALKAADGETLWKVYLCDDPPDGSSPWIPVGVSVEGASAYVATGTGLIFSLEADSGTVHWANRYRRSGELDKTISRRGIFSKSAWVFDGWNQDMAIPVGNRLVVFASDYNHLFVVDRRDGNLLWESPRRPSLDLPPAEYCLGVSGDAVYVAGKNVVRCYGLSGGRIQWQCALDDSFGRGALTDQAVCIPEGDEIVQLDLKTGKRKSQTHLFTLGDVSEPVGNLYSDGERILVLGMGRVTALTGLEYLFKKLEERIQAGDDGSALLTRMQLYLRLEKSDLAFEDFQAAFHRLKKTESHEKTLRLLYGTIVKLNLIQSSPHVAVELIAESEEFFAGASPAYRKNEVNGVFRALRQERDQLLQMALMELQEKKTENAIPFILKIVSFIDDDYLILAAQRAVAHNVVATDRELIKNALENEDAHVRMAAVSAIPKVFGPEAAAQYDKLLSDKNSRLRLTIARALANQGERRTLPILAELLGANDPIIRAKSAQTLQAFTGKRFGYVSYAPLQEREQIITEWKAWIEKAGQTAKLRFPIDPMSLLLGKTLICDRRNNRVIEVDADGKQTWSQPVIEPTYSQGLPNGHRLIVSNATKDSVRSRKTVPEKKLRQVVVEYDATGKEIWRLDNLPLSPYSARRLSNGNTLVTFNRHRKVVEYTPAKSVVWEIKVSGDPRDARRLENGNTLITLYFGDSVIEVDRRGKTVWQAINLKRPQSAQRLENGNTLVSLYYLGQVVELNRDGDVVWSQDNLMKGYHAQRLPNGNTVISSAEGIREVNPRGETVWKQDGEELKQAFRF